MAQVRPFKAIRPEKVYAKEVISLPYDVMNRKEACEMAKEKPHSFLHICRSEIDLPDEDAYSKKVYEKAKDNIEKYLEQGVFIREEKPMFYIYGQEMEGRRQTGIVATVAVDDYLNNVIKKHEFTRVEKEIDRINHFDVCNANTEPVFLTYRQDKRILAIIEAWTKNHEAEYDFTSQDGIGHSLWPIDDESVISTISSLFDQVPSLYIADGHHRSASAVKVGMRRREETPSYTGEEEFNFFMAVLFPDEDLKIFDYNRVISDLNGLSKDEFFLKLSEAFEVELAEKSPYKPEGKNYFAMFFEDQWYRLKAKDHIIDKEDVIKSLDVSILQDKLLKPILGIEDPRTDKRIDFIGGIRGLGELERRTRADMKVAFALYPVTIEDLLKVSDEGMVMPPKSTWFEPKLGSGLFLHEL